MCFPTLSIRRKDSVSERTLKWRPHNEARVRSRGGILLLGSTLSRLGIGSHACSSVRQSPATGSGLCPTQGLPLDPSSQQTPGSKTRLVTNTQISPP